MSRVSGKVTIPITRGSLALHDQNGKITEEYHIRTPEKARRALLRQLVLQHKGNARATFRALIARRTLGKNRLTESQKGVLTSDADYVKRTWYNTPNWENRAKQSRFYSSSSSSSDTMSSSEDEESE